MVNTYALSIATMTVVPQQGGNQNVVINCEYHINGTDGATPPHTCLIGGTASFGPPSDSFTPYEQLTEEQVIGWLEADPKWAATYASKCASIDASITQQVAQSIPQQMPLPWNQPAPAPTPAQ